MVDYYKIIDIFAEKVFAIVIPKNGKYGLSEFDRILNLWRDAEYLRKFYEKNKPLIDNNPFLEINSVYDFIDTIQDEVENLEQLIESHAYDDTLDELFTYLFNEARLDYEDFKKIRHLFLRVYGIKVGDVYLITGAAIKITKTMADHVDTNDQFKRLIQVSEFLKNELILDEDSLMDFMDVQ